MAKSENSKIWISTYDFSDSLILQVLNHSPIFPIIRLFRFYDYSYSLSSIVFSNFPDYTILPILRLFLFSKVDTIPDFPDYT